MDPMLGFLGTSAIVAIAGTAVKGILRPLSWAMLAAAALLFGSSKIVDATNALNQSPVLRQNPALNQNPQLSQNPALNQNPQLVPNPTSTFSSNSTISPPPLAQGWQSAAQGLNPSLSTLYGQNQPSQNQFGQNQPTQPQPGEVGQVEVGQSGQPTPTNSTSDSGANGLSTATSQTTAPPARVSTAQPIAGLW